MSKSLTLADMSAALAELHQLCAAMADCDATGKLRGKVLRLETALRNLEASGDLSAFRADLRAVEELVQRIHDAEPLTRMVRCVSALNERIARP